MYELHQTQKEINGTTRIGHKLQEILRDMVNKYQDQETSYIN